MTAAVLAGWAIEAIVASAVLMAAVLLLRVPVRRAFGAQIAYLLWALPLLRLLLPPLPAGWREAAATPIARASETITILVVDPARAALPAAPVADNPSLGPMLVLLWVIGAAGFLVWHLVRHTLFCRRMLGSSDLVDEVSGVRVIASDAAPGPLAFGVVRRYVAFPSDFAARYDAEERALALAHEIGHHERGDLVANWAALVVLAIHWFNPLAWRAFHAFRADQELANDARVLAGRSALERHAYACAIIKAAHGGAVSAACHLHTISNLKGRLRMLKTSSASRRQLAIGSGLVSILVLAGLGLTASGTSAATALSGSVGSAVGVDLQAAPPAPPVPPPEPLPAVAPPAPPAPPAVPLASNGKRIDNHVVRIRDGQRVEDSETDEILAGAPQVTERACEAGRDGDEKQLVLHDRAGNKRIMIICTNRIERAAADGAAMAARSGEMQRQALASALAGLRSARVSVEANRDMSPAHRAEALAGIDEGLAEVQRDLGKDD